LCLSLFFLLPDPSIKVVINYYCINPNRNVHLTDNNAQCARCKQPCLQSLCKSYRRRLFLPMPIKIVIIFFEDELCVGVLIIYYKKKKFKRLWIFLKRLKLRKIFWRLNFFRFFISMINMKYFASCLSRIFCNSIKKILFNFREHHNWHEIN
jgi:hypothetical protein